MFKVNSDVIVHFNDIINTFIILRNFWNAKKKELRIDVYRDQSLWKKMS